MSLLSSIGAAVAKAADAIDRATRTPKALLTLDVYRDELEDGPRKPRPDIVDIWNARHEAPRCQYVGIAFKATSGIAYDTTWFRHVIPLMRQIGADLYGVEWFWRAYHIARPTLNHRRQAEFFCREVEATGCVDEGMMCPWLDMEPPSSKALRGAHGNDVRDCAAVFKEVVAAELGRRIGVYGGRLASERWDIPRLGLARGTRSCVAMYRSTLDIDAIERAGWDLADVDQWQVNDGKHPPLRTKAGIWIPPAVPGVKGGDLDVSVFIGGGVKNPSIIDFRRREVNDSIIVTQSAPRLVA